MKPSRKTLALFWGNRALDATWLVLILGASAYLLLDTADTGGLPERFVSYQWACLALFLLTSLALLPGIWAQLRQALQEGDTHKQDPTECALDPSPREYVFFWKGGSQDMIPCCIAFFERHFSRYTLFHSFRSPHLSFSYLAKTGAASLIALPWIKTGLFVFLLSCSVHLALPHLLPTSKVRLLVPVLGVLFWIPGGWILWFRPYRKLWLQLLESDGCVQIRLTCASPLRPSKRDTLCRAMEAAIRAWPGREIGSERLPAYRAGVGKGLGSE